VLLKLLEKEPAERYPDMAQVVRDLDACRRGERVSVRVPTLFERIDKLMRRHKLATASLVAGVTAVLSLWRWHREELRLERESQILPRVQAENRAKQLSALRRGGTDADTPAADRKEQLLREAHRLLTAPDADADAAETALHAVMGLVRAQQSEGAAVESAAPGAGTELQSAERQVTVAEAAMVQRELALLRLARGDCAGARTALQRVAASGALPPVYRQMVRFETGIACWLDGDAAAAAAVWRQLLVMPETAPDIKALCRGALGTVTPETLAAQAETQLPVLRALGFWLAAARAHDPGVAAEWRRKAAHSAEMALPWLYYHMEHAAATPRHTHTERSGQ